MPGDMRPGTEWGMMWGFSDDVKHWLLFGGRPGLELKHQKEEIVGKKPGRNWQGEEGLCGWWWWWW